MSIFESCMNRQNRIDKVVNILGNEEIISKNLLIKDRIMNPSHYIVMIGETSSGKSALINSILNNKMLIESVKPTTGVVTEIVIDNEAEEKLLSIKKDGTIQDVDKNEFETLMVKPNDELNRLRYIGQSKENKYTGMRLFDTPGYGSLVNYHEEVLKEFIPESDFIVYVVSYRSGLGDDDYQFLKYIGEIIGNNVEVVLAINMCPKDIKEDNKRIIEIKKNVDECIHRNVETFLIESSSEKKPKSFKLWDYIYEIINNPKKKEQLAQNLKNYQDYILGECEIKINSKIASIEVKQDELEERAEIVHELVYKKKEIIDTIERGFTRAKVKSIKLIDKSAITIKENIENYIHDESKWSKKEETCSLMQNYYVPKLTNEETDNLLNYIEDEIISLDKIIEEMVNDTVKNLKNSIKISIPSYTEVMDGILKKHIGDAIKQATGEMFRKVDGRSYGRLNHNNSSSKNLNKLEGITKHTFAKNSDNKLNKLLKSIKAASIKGITHYLSIFTDSIFYLYDSLTWQSKINEISMKAIDNWARDVEVAIRKYLDELRESNKEEIISLFDELGKELGEYEVEIEEENLEELIRIKKEIEFILHKCLFMSL